MSSSYIAKDSAVLSQQLAVQEVTIQLGSPIISATSGATITLQFNETITNVVSASFIDDSAGTQGPVTAANRVVSGTTVALTLSAALAASDAVTVKYSTQF